MITPNTFSSRDITSSEHPDSVQPRSGELDIAELSIAVLGVIVAILVLIQACNCLRGPVRRVRAQDRDSTQLPVLTLSSQEFPGGHKIGTVRYPARPKQQYPEHQPSTAPSFQQHIIYALVQQNRGMVLG